MKQTDLLTHLYLNKPLDLLCHQLTTTTVTIEDSNGKYREFHCLMGMEIVTLARIFQDTENLRHDFGFLGYNFSRHKVLDYLHTI